VTLFVSNHKPSFALRSLALATAALILGLSIFSASPALHSWLHSHDSGQPGIDAAHHGVAADKTERSESARDNDACAVVMFAQGVLSGVGVILLSVLGWSVVGLVQRPIAKVARLHPRYWLPPLCGPPLS